MAAILLWQTLLSPQTTAIPFRLCYEKVFVGQVQVAMFRDGETDSLNQPW